jgi:hypothetical protein
MTTRGGEGGEGGEDERDTDETDEGVRLRRGEENEVEGETGATMPRGGKERGEA